MAEVTLTGHLTTVISLADVLIKLVIVHPDSSSEGAYFEVTFSLLSLHEASSIAAAIATICFF